MASVVFPKRPAQAAEKPGVPIWENASLEQLDVPALFLERGGKLEVSTLPTQGRSAYVRAGRNFRSFLGIGVPEHVRIIPATGTDPETRRCVAFPRDLDGLKSNPGGKVGEVGTPLISDREFGENYCIGVMRPEEIPTKVRFFDEPSHNDLHRFVLPQQIQAYERGALNEEGLQLEGCVMLVSKSETAPVRISDLLVDPSYLDHISEARILRSAATAGSAIGFMHARRWTHNTTDLVNILWSGHLVDFSSSSSPDENPDDIFLVRAHKDLTEVLDSYFNVCIAYGERHNLSSEATQSLWVRAKDAVLSAWLRDARVPLLQDAFSDWLKEEERWASSEIRVARSDAPRLYWEDWNIAEGKEDLAAIVTLPDVIRERTFAIKARIDAIKGEKGGSPYPPDSAERFARREGFYPWITDDRNLSVFEVFARFASGERFNENAFEVCDSLFQSLGMSTHSLSRLLSFALGEQPHAGNRREKPEQEQGPLTEIVQDYNVLREKWDIFDTEERKAVLGRFQRDLLGFMKLRGVGAFSALRLRANDKERCLRNMEVMLVHANQSAYVCRLALLRNDAGRFEVARGSTEFEPFIPVLFTVLETHPDVCQFLHLTNGNIHVAVGRNKVKEAAVRLLFEFLQADAQGADAQKAATMNPCEARAELSTICGFDFEQFARAVVEHQEKELEATRKITRKRGDRPPTEAAE